MRNCRDWNGMEINVIYQQRTNEKFVFTFGFLTENASWKRTIKTMHLKWVHKLPHNECNSRQFIKGLRFSSNHLLHQINLHKSNMIWLNQNIFVNALAIIGIHLILCYIIILNYLSLVKMTKNCNKRLLLIFYRKRDFKIGGRQDLTCINHEMLPRFAKECYQYYRIYR